MKTKIEMTLQKAKKIKTYLRFSRAITRFSLMIRTCFTRSRRFSAFIALIFNIASFLKPNSRACEAARFRIEMKGDDLGTM